MICNICGKEISIKGLGVHLKSHNTNGKEYYDTYLKKEDEGICKLDDCYKETSFLGLIKGYQDHCCISHAQLDKKTQYKIQETCLKRYGTISSNQSDIVKLKMKQTLINHYGVDNCQKCKEISDKTIRIRHKNNFEKYGVIETSKLKSVRDKISKSTRAYMLNRSQQEKDDFYNKIREIKREHHTLSTSKPEEEFYIWLLNIFNKQDIYRNYSADTRYPFACDFYIKSLDLFIELNLYWMHGGHWFDENSEEDRNKLNLWINKAEKGHKQYKAAVKVWSISDLTKHNIAIKNHLNYIVLWNNNDIINFQKQFGGNFDCET